MRVMSNPSGHLPCWERCIVKPDSVEKQTEIKDGQTEVVTTGGIIVPQPAMDQGKSITDPRTGKILNAKEEAEATGTLMAYGPMAFQDENGEYLPGSPEIGERVSFSRYAGTLIKGADGEDYRSMKDRDIQDIVVNG
jgi:co-chaperonin GroES (HSP10)